MQVVGGGGVQNYWLHAGRVDRIHRREQTTVYANINTTVIKNGDDYRHPKIRLRARAGAPRSRRKLPGGHRSCTAIRDRTFVDRATS